MSHWHRSALNAYELKRAKRTLRPITHEGTYPHWARFHPRQPFAVDAQISHMLRPARSVTAVQMTCCGFDIANFRAARNYKIPVQDIVSIGTTVRGLVSRADVVSCSRCYSVLDDIATWLNLGAVRTEYNDAMSAVHCSYAVTNNLTLCSWNQQSATTLDVDMFQASQNQCVTCKIICSRLYGVDAPEYGWEKYETIEQAANELKRQGKL